MLRANIRHILVVGPLGHLRGVVSMRDLVEDNVQQPDNHMAIDDVVRQPNVVAISPDTPAAQAARLMVRLRIGCLPVLDDQQSLVGVVSRTDVLRRLASALGG